MTSSISIHCMVCYEQFNTDDIYPIVMPCGHTYVCNICASKIDKCIECRASLYKETAVEVPTSSSRPQYSRRHSMSSMASMRTMRSSGRGLSAVATTSSFGNVPTSQELKRERLPLPKNLVLLSLIESSKMAQNTTSNRLLSRGGSSRVLDFENTQDADDIEENKIIFGADIANHASGTFAVAKTDGLKIYQTRSLNDSPSKKKKDSFFSKRSISTESLGSSTSSPITAKSSGMEMVDLGNTWHNQCNELVVNNLRRSAEDGNREMFLRYGDRVQVVSIVDKWAKLARGYGFVYLQDQEDLVKVGNALDKAAQIESMIYALSSTREKLREAKSVTEMEAIDLLKELQSTLVQEQDLTVIGAEAFDLKADDDVSEKEQTTSCNSISGKSIVVESFDEEEKIEEKAPHHTVFDTPMYQALQRSSSIPHPSDEDSFPVLATNNSENGENLQSDYLRRPRQKFSTSSARSSFRMESTFGSSRILKRLGSANFLEEALENLTSFVRDGSCGGGDVDMEFDTTTSHTENPRRNGHNTPSSRDMIAAAKLWRERNGKQASEYARVDFRTGMSGHSGFQSSHAQGLNFDGSGSPRRASSFKMSSHSGLCLTPKKNKLRPRRGSNDGQVDLSIYNSF